jgi:hypothetical protein
MAHLIDDETVAKMGHPVVVISSDVGHPPMAMANEIGEWERIVMYEKSDSWLGRESGFLRCAVHNIVNSFGRNDGFVVERRERATTRTKTKCGGSSLRSE